MDNREIARRYVETWLNPTSDWNAARNEMVAALDAATERGRMQGWSADEATVERVAIRLSMMDDDDERPLPSSWAGKMADYYRMLARAAIAAIPAPPAKGDE